MEKAKLYRWWVESIYGTVHVTAADKAQALVEAANRLNVSFSELAAEGTANRGPRVVEGTCPRCGGKTAGENLCYDCMRMTDMQERQRREYAKFCGKDRRAGVE